MGSKLDDRSARHDRYYRAAKKSHYAARSIYKLEEINERFKIFKKGQRVLDLGCRPGSWLQFASEKVGPKGRVVGLDRTPLDIEVAENVSTLVGDILAMDAAEIRGDIPCFQVVLTDMAPDTTGVALTDQIRSAELFTRALEISAEVGCPNGSFVGKIFMGKGFQEATTLAKKFYKKTKMIRPDATRKSSKEVYIVGTERRTG
jgi:23S rRNA (uridine2552-2'-O)-methyltransferase